MTVVIDTRKCTGCRGLPAPRCVEYCPGDLMATDSPDGKAYIREERDCWDCMTCVKLCPYQAITTKLPYQLADYKATLVPRVYKDRIKWRCTDVHGQVEEFDIVTLEA